MESALFTYCASLGRLLRQLFHHLLMFFLIHLDLLLLVIFVDRCLLFVGLSLLLRLTVLAHRGPRPSKTI